MTFALGLCHDLLDSSGQSSFGAEPLALLDANASLAWRYLDAAGPILPGSHLAGLDAIYVNGLKVTAQSVADAERLKVVARHGVGFDSVDVQALTDRGILLINTPLAIRRPMSTVALTFMLALAQDLLGKVEMGRQHRWSERPDHIGIGLTGRTLGLIGAGGIGRDLAKLAAPFSMRVLAADPYAKATDLAQDNIELTSLPELLRQADFVVVACLLNDSTYRLISTEQLSTMRRDAFLINVARGPIVDEQALIAALQNGTIAGAGLDVFEQEPPAPDNPLFSMPNVVATPHNLGWTDENFGGIARSALGGILDVASGRWPAHVVNPEVKNHKKVRAWLKD